jgi:hypothetical protein
MHVSKADLEPMVIGEYEGRTVDAGEFRIAFESMPAQFPPDESPFKGLPDDHDGHGRSQPGRGRNVTAGVSGHLSGAPGWGSRSGRRRPIRSAGCRGPGCRRRP